MTPFCFFNEVGSFFRSVASQCSDCTCRVFEGCTPFLKYFDGGYAYAPRECVESDPSKEMFIDRNIVRFSEIPSSDADEIVT